MSDLFGRAALVRDRDVQALRLLLEVRQRVQLEARDAARVPNLPQGVQEDHARLLLLTFVNANEDQAFKSN